MGMSNGEMMFIFFLAVAEKAEERLLREELG